jgi:hypothetical protein
MKSHRDQKIYLNCCDLYFQNKLCLANFIHVLLCRLCTQSSKPHENYGIHSKTCTLHAQSLLSPFQLDVDLQHFLNVVLKLVFVLFPVYLLLNHMINGFTIICGRVLRYACLFPHRKDSTSHKINSFILVKPVVEFGIL